MATTESHAKGGKVKAFDSKMKSVFAGADDGGKIASDSASENPLRPMMDFLMVSGGNVRMQ